MKSTDILSDNRWFEFSGQSDTNVTYFFLGTEAVVRLSGSSDILYIGQTKQPIRKRYLQETRTKTTPRNTQQTNIRTTHVFGKLGLGAPMCFYTKRLNVELSADNAATFLPQLATWDKQFFMKLTDGNETGPISLPLEKWLLVRYAAEHLELPPLNNRM